MNLCGCLLFALIGVGCAVSSPNKNVPGESCSVNGQLSCSSDCRSILLCNEHKQTVIKTCPLLKYCDRIHFDCSANSCQKQPTTIACHSYGLFPDPFDCTKFHICSTDNGSPSVNLTCPYPTAYDPLSTNCVKTLQDRVCLEKPLPRCDQDLQRGPQEENPNIYYICINGIPNLYRCDPGLIYINEIGGCGLATTTTAVAVTTTTASPASITTTPATTTESPASITTTPTTTTSPATT